MQLENQKQDTFFSKKKIWVLTISIIIFVILIFLTSKFLFDINFNDIYYLLEKSNHENNIFGLWLFLMFIFPIYNVIFKITPYAYKLRKKGIKVKWYNWLLFSFICLFISGITPFAMGSEPYAIYWLKKRGLSLKESTALVASFTILNPAMQVLITWPSFFVLCSQYGSFASDAKWVGCFWAVFVGLIIDLIGTCFWTLMSYSKNMHYLVNLLINFGKKLVRLNYKTKEQIRYEYKENQAFKKLFMKELKDWKFVLLISLGGLLWNVLYYCEIIFAFKLMDPLFRFNAGELFNYVNVATTANNFIPIPSAEGTLQGTLLIFIQGTNTNDFIDHNELVTITNNSVFIWRTFTFYITTILGSVAFVIEIFKQGFKHYLIKRNTISVKFYKRIIKKESLFLDNNEIECLAIILFNDNISFENIKQHNSAIKYSSISHLIESGMVKTKNQDNIINYYSPLKKYILDRGPCEII